MLCFPPWHKENRQTLPCPTICSCFCTQPEQPFSGVFQYFRNHRDSKSLVPEKCCIGKEICTISAYDQLKMEFQVSNVWSEQRLKHLEILPNTRNKRFRGGLFICLFIYCFSLLCFVWNFWEAFLDFYWESKRIKTQNWIKTCRSFFSKCHKKRKLYLSTKSILQSTFLNNKSYRPWPNNCSDMMCKFSSSWKVLNILAESNKK